MAELNISQVWPLLLMLKKKLNISHHIQQNETVFSQTRNHFQSRELYIIQLRVLMPKTQYSKTDLLLLPGSFIWWHHDPHCHITKKLRVMLV